MRGSLTDGRMASALLGLRLTRFLNRTNGTEEDALDLVPFPFLSSFLLHVFLKVLARASLPPFCNHTLRSEASF